jgi:hypothetical protein
MATDADPAHEAGRKFTALNVAKAIAALGELSVDEPERFTEKDLPLLLGGLLGAVELGMSMHHDSDSGKTEHQGWTESCPDAFQLPVLQLRLARTVADLKRLAEDDTGAVVAAAALHLAVEALGATMAAQASGNPDDSKTAARAAMRKFVKQFGRF